MEGRSSHSRLAILVFFSVFLSRCSGGACREDPAHARCLAGAASVPLGLSPPRRDRHAPLETDVLPLPWRPLPADGTSRSTGSGSRPRTSSRRCRRWSSSARCRCSGRAYVSSASRRRFSTTSASKSRHDRRPRAQHLRPDRRATAKSRQRRWQIRRSRPRCFAGTKSSYARWRTSFALLDCDTETLVRKTRSRTRACR